MSTSCVSVPAPIRYDESVRITGYDVPHSPGERLLDIAKDHHKLSASPTADDAEALTIEGPSTEPTEDSHQARDQYLESEDELCEALITHFLTSLFCEVVRSAAAEQNDRSHNADSSTNRCDGPELPERDPTPREGSPFAADAANTRPSISLADCWDDDEEEEEDDYDEGDDESVVKTPQGLNLGTCWLMAYRGTTGFCDYFTELAVTFRPVNWLGHGRSPLHQVENAVSTSTQSSKSSLSDRMDASSSLVPRQTDNDGSADLQCSESLHHPPAPTTSNFQDSDDCSSTCGSRTKLNQGAVRLSTRDRTGSSAMDWVATAWRPTRAWGPTVRLTRPDGSSWYLDTGETVPPKEYRGRIVLSSWADDDDDE